MARTVITVTVNHHASTRAIARIRQLLDFCKDGYGVWNLDYTVEDDP